jgi:excisionase family DNA binding protein
MPGLVTVRPVSLPELLTADQAAELLGVSSRLVWLLAKQKELTPVHIRSCARWRRADVLKYIERLRPHSVSEKPLATSNLIASQHPLCDQGGPPDVA